MSWSRFYPTSEQTL